VNKLGGGSIWGVGCYPISFARLIAGSGPVDVFGWQIVQDYGVDETFAGQMIFPGDVFAQFDCGFRTPERTHIELIGDKGNIVLEKPFKPGLNENIVLTTGDETRMITIPGEELYLGEVENMADAILNGVPTRMSLADSRNNVATIQALLASAAKGQRVRL